MFQINQLHYAYIMTNYHKHMASAFAEQHHTFNCRDLRNTNCSSFG